VSPTNTLSSIIKIVVRLPIIHNVFSGYAVLFSNHIAYHKGYELFDKILGTIQIRVMKVI